ncbi:hypothetical protein ABKZ82_002418 [Salmonella enterica]
MSKTDRPELDGGFSAPQLCGYFAKSMSRVQVYQQLVLFCCPGAGVCRAFSRRSCGYQAHD